ncbi:MAG TPA: VOC family protein [Candidatus Limnocylindrales bacterium]
MTHLASIVAHCTDPYVAGPFWALALGQPPVREDEVKLREHGLADGEAVLLRDPAGLRPDVWVSPHADAANQDSGPIHLDLQLDDLAEVEQPHPWTVLEAPDGVLFCAIHPRTQ